jgi:hypothetical protein
MRITSSSTPPDASLYVYVLNFQVPSGISSIPGLPGNVSNALIKTSPLDVLTVCESSACVPVGT